MKNIIDDTKKEGKAIGGVTIFTYLFSFFFPIYFSVSSYDNFSRADLICAFILLFALASCGLFYWLCHATYRLVVDSENIYVHLLFKDLKIGLDKITGYSYNAKKKMYVFKFFTSKGSVSITTRYKNELIEILQQKGIPEVTQ